MSLDPAEIDDLLGAWALDALDPAERERVDRALAADSSLAEKAAELRQVVFALDVGLRTAPSDDDRSILLAHVRGEPAPLVEVADPLTVFESQVVALQRLLEGLAGDDWLQIAKPYRWSVHGLVAHLLVIETYTQAQLGLRELASDSERPHLEIGAEQIADELRGQPEQTADVWSRAALLTIDRLRSGEGPARDDRVDFHQWPLTVESLLIARGFEVWTHADDIRRATDRPLVAPDPAELRTMAQLSVNSLPLVLPLIAPQARLLGARIVLTGEGGAAFDIGDPVRRTTLIVADVVDYCRLAARRIPVADFAHEVEGDPDIAGHLLAAAQAFAV